MGTLAPKIMYDLFIIIAPFPNGPNLPLPEFVLDILSKITSFTPTNNGKRRKRRKKNKLLQKSVISEKETSWARAHD